MSDGAEPPNTVAGILVRRGKTHGDFKDNAEIANDLRSVMRGGPNWENILPEQRLALDEIALKIARILSAGSDPTFAEHWNDIEGYAKLGGRQCS